MDESGSSQPSYAGKPIVLFSYLEIKKIFPLNFPIVSGIEPDKSQTEEWDDSALLSDSSKVAVVFTALLSFLIEIIKASDG